MTLRIVPIPLREARAFVAQNHRHNVAPRGWLFGVGLRRGDELVGVGIAGRPVAWKLQDGTTIEITRCCTLGEPNACSRIYGALCRAAAALGYRLAVTTTLENESGSSLRAAGFERAAKVRAEASWSRAGRQRYDADLFGTETRPTGAKVRWQRRLRA